MLFWVKVCQWPVVIIGARRVFQGKMPHIPIRLQELTSTSGKTQGGYKEPTGKRLSFVGKGNERCQRVTWRTTLKENRWKGWYILMEIDQVDHGEIWLLLKRYQTNFGAKGSFTLKLGACVDIVFLEKQVKRDKERQPMKSRAQSVDWRKKRTVNTIRWWSKWPNRTVG
jgi:hypothetical protein